MKITELSDDQQQGAPQAETNGNAASGANHNNTDSQQSEPHSNGTSSSNGNHNYPGPEAANHDALVRSAIDAFCNCSEQSYSEFMDSFIYLTAGMYISEKEI